MMECKGICIGIIRNAESKYNLICIGSLDLDVQSNKSINQANVKKQEINNKEILMVLGNISLFMVKSSVNIFDVK
eukprot:UN04979